MKASRFVSQYASKGPIAWENAALGLFQAEQGPTNPWVPIALSSTDKNGQTHSAIAHVSSDYLTLGEGALESGDTMRLPLTPKKAQEILNLDGSLLPTPWLVYQIWRQSVRIPRNGMVPNKGADLAQYAAHNTLVQSHVARSGWNPSEKPLSGGKKDVVVSRLMKPGRVIIFGWYRPEPDVFKDARAWNDPSPEKQPQQAHSDAHGEGYVDYSHGIRKVHPIMIVDGQEKRTEDVYQDPLLSSLVSHEGPLSVTRYAAPMPAGGAKVSSLTPVRAKFSDKGLQAMIHEWFARQVQKRSA